MGGQVTPLLVGAAAAGGLLVAARRIADAPPKPAIAARAEAAAHAAWWLSACSAFSPDRQSIANPKARHPRLLAPSGMVAIGSG